MDPTLDSWEFWWEFNRDALLLSDGTQARIVTGATGQLTGLGLRERSGPRDTALVSQHVVPALQEILSSEHEAELLDSAVLALARVTPGALANTVADDIRLSLSHDVLSVSTSSALSLGVLGAPRSLPLLNALMSDTTSGRQSIGGGPVPWQVRVHAAIGLGLVNDPLAIDPLIDVATNSTSAERELRTAAVVALGLMRNERMSDAVKGLLDLLDLRALDTQVRSAIPTSLAKLGDVSVVPRLLELYEDRDTDVGVRQSVVIALGRLGDLGHDKLVDALAEAVRSDSDAGTRHFACISLARVGARNRDGELLAVQRRIEKLLRRELTDPGHRMDRSWHALAAALHARGYETARPAATEALRQGYEDENDPSVRAAFAIALGLLGAEDVAPRLLEDFRASRDEGLQGHLAVSLGLLGYRAAADALIPVCRDGTVSDMLRQQVVRGLALMEDPQLTPVLLEALAQANTLPLAWSLGRALGHRRDDRSVEPLVQLLSDKARPVPARAFACVALGLVADRAALRFSMNMAEDSNYLVRTATLEEILSL